MKISKVLIRVKKKLSKLKKNRLEIILYHSVKEEENLFLKSSHNIMPEIFQKQMKFLKDNYHIISLNEIRSFSKDNIKDGPYVCICFDDGYSCIISEAYPILEEYHIPATLFICPSVIDNNDVLWRDKIRYIINCNIEDKFIDYLKKASSKGKYNFQLLEKYSFYVWSKFEFAFSDMSIQEDLNNFFHLNDINIREMAKINQLYILEKDIKEYKYLEFGNHTWTHPILSKLTYNQQKEEIINTHNFLVAKNIPTYSLSLPFSPYNESTLKICKEINYHFILNVSDQVNLLKKMNDDLLIIHRKMSPKTLNGFMRLFKF